MRRLLCVLGLFALTGATCQNPAPPDTGTEKREAALRAFKSADEMRQYLADQAVARLNGQTPGGGWPVFFLAESTGSPVRDGDATNGAPQATGGGAKDPFSTTNTQEAGVDESDLVKNDGEFVYLIKGNTLRIIKVRPANAIEQVASVDLPDNPDSLYLRGDKLIAISRSWGWWGGWGGWEGDVRVMDVAQSSSAPACAAGADCGYGVNRVTVTVLDIADRTAPTAAATIKLDGSLASSRLIENRLYLVVTTMPPLPDNPTPEAIEAQPLEKWLPDYQIVAADGSSTGGEIVGWETSYYPVNPDGYGLTIVSTIDVDNPGTAIQSEAVTADAGTIYASTSALYVTDTKYDTSGNGRQDTAVHKFALSDAGAVYKASGLIPGRLLNQYSLGEQDGYLRTAVSVEDWSGWSGGVVPLPMTEPAVGVATIAAEVSSTEPTVAGTAVYVLHENTDADKLEIVGRIEGIKPDERLYSARFVGDRGFLVTFRQVDPLFTVDLKDPTRPALVGELKVPGYSEYIHLMDENHLLTIGHDADENTGLMGGVKLSIFDVTDPANPVEAHKRIIGARGTSSEATGNPKAFNYFAAKDVLAFPAMIYEGAPWGYDNGSYFGGLLVYRVTAEDGFTPLGRISTQFQNGTCDYCGYGWPAYTRGVFIGDDVYAVTDYVVRAAPLADLATLSGSLTLPGSPTDSSTDGSTGAGVVR